MIWRKESFLNKVISVFRRIVKKVRMSHRVLQVKKNALERKTIMPCLNAPHMFKE